MNPLISLIIINYNTPELIIETTEKIIQHTDYKNYDIIIIDNCSTDHSFENIKKLCYKYPDKIHAYKTYINLGYGKGCNIGAKISDAEYLVFMNSDVYPVPEHTDWLEKFLTTFDDDVGIVAPKLIHPNGLIAGGPVHQLDIPQPYWMQEDKGQYDVVEECLSICGACFMVKKDVFNSVGMFDPEYFHYFEETHLCLAMKQKGFKVMFNGLTTVIHEHMQSCRDQSLLNQYAMMGKAYFDKKWKDVIK
jgi:GT2 family glycosyltransferase